MPNKAAFEDLTVPDWLGDEGSPFDLLGRKIGTIRIHKLLGEGGMGAVYAGFDERLRREVALKAVRSDSLTPNGRARLLTEARILSRLNHPNICAIHDFVAGDATDFLVLELIRGTTLREAIQAGIPAAARIGVAERIADALVAAHAQGIVHRDLKSSNVMLTPDGGVKILDFGIARLGEEGFDGASDIDPDRTGLFSVPSEESFLFARTAPGRVIGTAGCMSPEQARGEQVTVASDMYSLGLLMQELFTGKPPYEPDLDGVSLLRKVQKGHSLPVTGLDAHLTDLIERLKSLTPENRPSAAEALQSLRWIEDKPRRRLRLVVAGLALLLTVAGIAKYTYDLRRERDAAVRARQEAELSRQQGDGVVSFLTDLFKVSDPGEARGTTVTARELLDHGAQTVRRDLRTQPLVQARLLDTIGQVYFKLGLYDEARPALEDALRIRRAPGGDALDLATSLEHLALLDQAQNRPPAEGRFQQALRIREAKTGRRNPDVARLLSNLGVFYAVRGDLAKGESLFRQALEIREATLGHDHPDVATSLNNLGMAVASRGDRKQAEILLRRGLAIRERVLPADHPDLAANLEALAVIEDRDTHFVEAVRLHRRALAISEKVLGPEHPRTTLVVNNLAETLSRLGQNGEAETLLRRSLHAREASLGPVHPDVGVTLTDLAGLYREEKRYSEAEPLYRRAQSLLEAAYPKGHPRLTELRESYALQMRATGRPGPAAAMEAQAKAAA
ncbi:MAG TPA: serine/threonine-protein kinase [Thermoanaerobaculia bacterium]|nr:serine/threonine-protein kinase [Thermoanaerobaculia bacterium]